MGFAEVDDELEMEPEIESLEERVIEPVTDSGIPVKPVDPMSFVADEDWMRGLAPLVRILREPATLFGVPSDRRPESRRPVDWQSAPRQIQDCLEFWEASCTDVLLHLMLAAELLRDHSVKICRGEVQVTILQHEDLSPSVFIELSIDASSMQAMTLTHELDGRAVDMELACDGFVFCFMDGEGGDDDEPGATTDLALASLNRAVREEEFA
jgi:hypothetical protein